MKYVSVAEMVAIEKEADASGLTYAQMMEHAGRGLAEAVMRAYNYLLPAGVLGLVGSGNNGGDTLVALARMARNGWLAVAYLARPRPVDDPLVARLVKAGGRLVRLEDDPDLAQLDALIAECAVFMDGILGTGVRLPLKGEVATVLAHARRSLAEQPQVHVVAVDCPSGVDCDSGEAAAECIPAELTVTMAAYKRGLLRFPAYNLVGQLALVGIGLGEAGPYPAAWERLRRFVVEGGWVAAQLPARPLDAHKGTFGTALVVASSANYTGAALLAGEAAYRAGAGLVTVGVPASLQPALAGHLPEATWLPLPETGGALNAAAAQVVHAGLDRATALLLGPGFGLAEATRDFVDRLLPQVARQEPDEASLPAVTLPPLVVDADGLKLLAALPGWPQRLPGEAVLTPHPGEMSILCGQPVAEIQAARVETAERFAALWGHCLVLKGAFTVVAAPDGRTAVIPVATSALARAGTGDVLAGIIVGLRAQGLEAFTAAAAGAWIHARAGVLAAQEMGSTAPVLAGDVLAFVPDVLAELV